MAGPAWIHHNVVTTTPVGAALWPKLTWKPGCIKILPNAESATPPNAPGAGILVYNNTFHFPAGDAFTLTSEQGPSPGNFHFINNVCIADALASVSQRTCPGSSSPGTSSRLRARGRPGRARSSGSRAGGRCRTLRLSDPAQLNFAPLSNSPLLGAGVDRPDLPGASRDVGAIPAGGDGNPPETGPRVTTSGPTPP